MKYSLVVKAEVIQDLSAAFEWYEQKRIGLGSEFLDEVESITSASHRIPNDINHTEISVSLLYIVFPTELFMRSRKK